MRSFRRPVLLLLAILPAACSTPPVVQAPPAPVPVAAPPPATPAGLDRVVGKDATSIEALFGDPDQDLRLTGARRLVFAGPVCVLDVYLYPKTVGAEPVATYLDARRPDGQDFDRASCIAALSRRKEAR